MGRDRQLWFQYGPWELQTSQFTMLLSFSSKESLSIRMHGAKSHVITMNPCVCFSLFIYFFICLGSKTKKNDRHHVVFVGTQNKRLLPFFPTIFFIYTPTERQLKQFIYFFSHTKLYLSSFANTYAACNSHASSAEFPISIIISTVDRKSSSRLQKLTPIYTLTPPLDIDKLR